MNTDFIGIIAYITAVQLSLLGIVLFTRVEKVGLTSSRLLAFFMISNSFLILLYSTEKLLPFGVPPINGFYFLLTPLLFLYTKSLTHPAFLFKKPHLKHFILAGIAFLLYISGIFFSIFSESKVFLSEDNYVKVYFLSSVLLHFQVAIYLFLLFNGIIQYRKSLKEIFSSIEKLKLTWLLIIVMAFTLMWLVDLIHFLLSVNHVLTQNISRNLVIVSLLINFIFANAAVYKGLKHPVNILPFQEPAKSYKSGLTDKECASQAQQLKIFMESKKPYLEPSLTIKDLSDQIGIHPKYLSQIINSQFKRNFYDFINFYRINEAKELISVNKDTPVTILEILYASGFNSKSVFNAAFKNVTGCTPSEFKKRKNG